MNSAGFFRDRRIEKGATVYAMFRTGMTYPEISYSIAEYVVTAVGRVYLTARPVSGGKPVKFGPLPGISPAHGLYLHEVGGKAGWKTRLYPTMQLAKRAKVILEKADAKEAQARR